MTDRIRADTGRSRQSRAFAFVPGQTGRFSFSRVEDLPRAGWDIEYHQLGCGPFAAWTEMACSSRVHLAETAYFPGIRIMGTVPGEAYAVSICDNGPLPFDGGGRLRETQAVVTGPGGAIALSAPDGFHFMAAVFERRFFEAELAARWGHRSSRGALIRRLDIPGPWARRALLGQWRALLSAALRNPERLVETGLADLHDRAVLDALFRATESVHLTQPDAGRLRLAQRTERYLRDNLAEEVSIDALCAQWGVATRTLQQGFRDAFGMPPKAYLNMLRVNEVRRDLLKKGPKARVSEIALQWGFTHLGRFSGFYARVFGESPRETLHRQARATLSGR